MAEDKDLKLINSEGKIVVSFSTEGYWNRQYKISITELLKEPPAHRIVGKLEEKSTGKCENCDSYLCACLS